MKVLERTVEILTVLAYIVVLGVLIALGATGCGGAPRIVEKPVVVPKVTRCTDGAAPAWEPVTPPAVCQPGRVCYATPDAAALADDIERLRAWASEVGALCGAAK